MLDSIRKRKNNILFTGLILTVAVVMGVFGMSNLNNDGASGGAAAWVNGEPISAREFRDELEDRMQRYRQMLGDAQDDSFLQAMQIPQRTLDEMVKWKLVAQQARRIGVQVTDRELADYIRALPYFQKDGKFDPELYKRLPDRGIEEARQRERLELVRYQGFLLDRVRLSKLTSDRVADLENAKVDVDVAKIDFNSLADREPVQPAAIAKFQSEVPEAELKQHYETERAKYVKKARYHFRQIRVGVPFQAKDAQRAEARTKMTAIAKDVTAKNFVESAKKSSDDEFAKTGGDAGWRDKDAIEPALETALAKLNKDEVSKPVETPFGLYLVQLLEREPERPQPFDEVRVRVADSLYRVKRRTTFKDATRKNWEAMLAQGKPIDAELKKLGIETKATGMFPLAQGFVPQLGNADAVLDVIYELTPKEPVAKKLVPLADQFVYVRLRKFEHTIPKPGKDGKDSSPQAVNAVQAELFEKWIEDLKTKSSVKVAKGLNKAEPNEAGMGG